MSEALPLRYLGSKARLASLISEPLESADPTGIVVDMFAGVGHVSAAFADKRQVVATDVSPFAVGVLKWRLKSPETRLEKQLHSVTRLFRRKLRILKELYARELSAELQFLRDPSARMAERIEEAFGTPPGVARRRGPHSLVTSYFANAYFGVLQSLEFDALRFALTSKSPSHEVPSALRTEGMVGLYCAMTHLTNSPGHFAQFFPVTNSNAETVARLRRRSVWTQWQKELQHLVPPGERDWRANNRVRRAEVLSSSVSTPPDAIHFADPPYTDSQYSRFYHVLDTVALYDYPECSYKGRYRQERFRSPFCVKGEVIGAFNRLIRISMSKSRALYVTYPREGLLQKAGGSVAMCANEVGAKAKIIAKYELRHAAPGRMSSRSHSVTEELWRIC